MKKLTIFFTPQTWNTKVVEITVLERPTCYILKPRCSTILFHYLWKHLKAQSRTNLPDIFLCDIMLLFRGCGWIREQLCGFMRFWDWTETQHWAHQRPLIISSLRPVSWSVVFHKCLKHKQHFYMPTAKYHYLTNVKYLRAIFFNIGLLLIDIEVESFVICCSSHHTWHLSNQNDIISVPDTNVQCCLLDDHFTVS